MLLRSSAPTQSWPSRSWPAVMPSRSSRVLASTDNSAALCTARGYEQFLGLIRPQVAISLGSLPGGVPLNWT